MKEYLPIGTVVRLKEGEKALMIYGLRQIHAESGEEYDYVACLYPEGNISDDYTYLFNADSIEEIYYKGWETEAHEALVVAIND